MPTNHLSHGVHLVCGRGDRWILTACWGKKILAESGSFGFNVSPVLKTRHEDQRVSSAIKGACPQAWRPEFSPWDSHSRRREPTHVSSPLTSKCTQTLRQILWLFFHQNWFFLQLFFFQCVFGFQQ